MIYEILLKKYFIEKVRQPDKPPQPACVERIEKSMNNRKYIETAITLARMYGVAETLHPWDYLENEKFICKIEKWTEEFLKAENQDILKFFESKAIE